MSARGFGILCGLASLVWSGMAWSDAPATQIQTEIETEIEREIERPAAPTIAVVRFDQAASPDSGDLDIAALLASRLTQRLPSEVVQPTAFDAPASANPEAHEVREWAEQAGVDAVVFGRSAPASGADGGVGLAVDVRSGHSGVTSASYEVAWVTAADAEPAVDGLAESILSGLGYRAPAGPAALAAAAAAAEPEGKRLAVLRKGEAISIRSDELEVTQDGDERHLVFSRGVRVEQGDVKLEADRLDAYYKAGESQPDRLIARGSVRVIHGERRASCDTATFYNEQRRVVCSGHAELKQGCDLVRGEEIQFDLREERVRVVGAASVVIQDREGDGKCNGGQL